MIKSSVSSASLFLAVVLIIQLVPCRAVKAYTPQSPDVQKLIRKAVRFLSTEGSYSDHERVLAALALLKAGEPETHPIVDKARKDCLEWCQSRSMVEGSLDSVYQVSVVGLFLCELDPVLYRTQITRLIDSLEKRQKECGGWGYPKPSTDWLTGDTSMTQYAILFAWTAKATGAEEMGTVNLRKATNWLLRTQDPTGAWGYQGKDNGSFKRVKQTEVRHSLAAAGVGSLYVCSGILGFTNDRVDSMSTRGEIPPALKLIVANAPERTPDDVIDPQMLRRGIRDGDKWFSENFRIETDEYTLYYMYTLERYQSFRYAAEGRSRKEPGWYNEGVELLKKRQLKNGEWDLDHGNGRVVDTCFGILFLIRSTQKTLAKLNDEFDGLLVAGRGIPSSTSNMKMKNGQLIRTAFQGSTSALLDILEDDSHPDFDSVVSMNVPIPKNRHALDLQQKKMRRLARAEKFESRFVAVRTLSKVNDLENVPTLIYALSDPDARVVVAARDGLRFISRRFGGFGLSTDPTKEERDDAIQKWKAWYKDIRPNAKFED